MDGGAVCGLVIGGAVLLVVILLGVTIYRRMSTNRAADRRVEFLTTAEPADVASAIARAIRSQTSGLLNSVKVVSAGALGVVVQYSGPLSKHWEIRVDFEQHDPVHGVIYLENAYTKDGSMKNPGAAHKVFDLSIQAIRDLDRNVQIHGN